jgi:peptidoglycan-associated lipoprotein
MREAGARALLTEQPPGSGTYVGQIDLTGIKPGRYPLTALGEGADGPFRFDGAEVVEVAEASATERTRLLNAALKPAYFASDRWHLSEEARGALAESALLLEQAGNFRATVEGHADERGTDAYNYALGIWRAKSVKDYLVSRGIEPSRLTILSRGRTRPAASGTGPEAWARNRRVEIVVTSVP